MRPSPASRKPSSTSSARENILHAIKEVFALLYNDRAIAYRRTKGFIHADVALSAGVQRMVRSDRGAAGVMFTPTLNRASAVFVTASYGLGETVAGRRQSG